ncbi:hypothetical protein Agabi119p4_1620 [Agaricus bisporus var. burnettii]|uniref:Uncharacterized protein n=1 Tax=Agaricus bisporus var. burnettii TaxID=192524 RepID=A0A8H7F7U9_AGABI|nr:hypothetical protein Agabi119p4_1620 [Agaricus bisporus var. burnettii]
MILRKRHYSGTIQNLSTTVFIDGILAPKLIMDIYKRRHPVSKSSRMLKTNTGQLRNAHETDLVLLDRKK